MVDPPKLLIATPTDGRPDTALVTWGYHNAVRNLERSGAVCIPSTIGFADDLARARSRMVWYALQRPEWTHVLWWDDDVVPPDPSIVGRMLATGHDVIGAPYPRKRIPVAFPYKPLDRDLRGGSLTVVGDCVEVELLAFGFMITSRSCLEKMCKAYEDEWFSDGHPDTTPHETVALFRQVMTPQIRIDGRRHRELYSEDYSFCWRWRGIGGAVWMYAGGGAPLVHVGGNDFRGAREDIGRAR